MPLLAEADSRKLTLVNGAVFSTFAKKALMTCSSRDSAMFFSEIHLKRSFKTWLKATRYFTSAAAP